MPKHLELEFSSIGEMITMLRFNDRLTAADLHRPVRVTIDIDTEGPLCGDHLHIGGPLRTEWFDSLPAAAGTTAENARGGIRTLARRLIGFRQCGAEAKTEQKTEQINAGSD